MKKLFLLAATALTFASCANDEYLWTGQDEVEPPAPSNATMFAPSSDKMTRALKEGADAAGLLNQNFVVEGVSSDGTVTNQTEQFDHYNVNYTEGSAHTTETNTAGWEYVAQDKHSLSAASAQTIKYWDFGAKQYDFVAFSYGASDKTKAVLTKIKTTNLGNDGVTDGKTEAVYTVTGTATDLAKTYLADLVTLYNHDGVSEYKGATVTPHFRSMGTKVRIAFYEVVPGYSVKNLKFYNAEWDGSATSTAGADAATLFASNAIFPSNTTKGTMSVYYPTVGWANSSHGTLSPDYNKAQVKFEAGSESGDALVNTKTFGILVYKAEKEGSEQGTDKFLGRESSSATYAGDVTATNHAYQLVLPLGETDNLQIRVEYDLVPTDGGAGIIHVRDARAVVPKQYANWKPNHAYTYIFKISDATNGWTGIDGDGNVVEGLTPITFDACVEDTEDETQETVTTVSTPSITTYQDGVNVSAISEYKPGVVYASVMDGTDAVNLSGLTSPKGVAVYKVTTDGTAITEAIIQDMLDGKKHNTGITLASVGYELASTIPGIGSISAAKFTAEGGCTYAFMYTDGSKNYVKVIKIASEGVAGIAYNWQAAVNSYTYTAIVTATGPTEITFTYATGTVSSDKHEILYDLARYLGAIYYAGGAQNIVWNDGTNDNTYTWDPANAGYLKGSNWYNTGTNQTLVKDITTWFQSNTTASELTMKIDGTDTTLKFVVN